MDDEPGREHKYNYYGHLYHLAQGGGTLGDWTVEQILGHGGYGAVAQVRRADGVAGALKLTHPAICHKEARILRHFDGTSAPRLLADAVVLSDLGIPAAYYVMEQAELTVAQHFEGGGVRGVPNVQWCTLADNAYYEHIYRWIPYDKRVQDALAIVGAVLIALRAAGTHVHGDLCPSNVLLFRNGDNAFEAKVADWGNARTYVKDQTSYTLLGGKELWCPPSTRAYLLGESGAKPEPPTDKIDIYGLGAMVCWMLTGTVPNQIARWHTRKDTKSVAGLPIDRTKHEWHEFLIATTRADRERRIGRDDALELLAAVRSGASRPVIVPPPPDPAVQPTQPIVRAPALRRPRNRPRFVAARALVAAIIVGGASAASGSHPPPGPPQPAIPRCVTDHFLCDRPVLDQLADATGTTFPEGLQLSVRGWQRDTLGRDEYRKAQQDWNLGFYGDVVVARLDIRNTRNEPVKLVPDWLGLVIAVSRTEKLDGLGVVPISVPGVDSRDWQLVWVPPLHSASVDAPLHGKLLPETTIPPGARPMDYPFTALFDLPKLGSIQIIGLGGMSTKTSLTSLLPVEKWPLGVDKVDDLYSDYTLLSTWGEYHRGMCYLQLYDAGLWHAKVDCSRPHYREILATPTVSAEYDDKPDSDINGWTLCQEAFASVANLHQSLKSWVYPQVPPQQHRKAGVRTVICELRPEDPAVFWVGPQSPAAKGLR